MSLGPLVPALLAMTCLTGCAAHAPESRPLPASAAHAPEIRPAAPPGAHALEIGTVPATVLETHPQPVDVAVPAAEAEAGR